MTRLRFSVTLNPSKTEAGDLATYGSVTFAPMDALADGLGGLDTSLEKPADELSASNYSYFAEGDLLIAKVTPCFENGKKALVSSLPNRIGFATSEVHVVRPNTARVNPNYLRYLLSSVTFKAAGTASMTGAGGLRRISDNAIKDFDLPVSDLDAQKTIASYLDREAVRIDQLIAKKERIADLISAKWEALIHDARSETDAHWVRFNTVTCRVQRPIGASNDTSYIPLGLFNRGRGFFKKVETEEDDLGDSDFFWVREGDIVFSGQFAWEGAIGLVTDAEDGCVVSHRYPVYRAKDKIEAGYLYAFFRTAHGAFLMDNCSRGAAGRNRPLNTWLLEREQILVPSNATQKKIAQLVTLEGKIRQRVGQYVQRAVELRSSLITAAVIGQIDIREKAAVVTTKPDRATFRVIVGAEIVHRHRDTRKFGRIKNQKLLYLAETHAGINELSGNFIRFAAGPYDEALIKETERGLEAAGYCRAQTSEGDSGGIAYVPLANAGRHTAELKSLLGDRADALRKLIDLLHDFDKDAVEAIATLYAVWNDALIDGERPDEAAIIRGVLTEWHPDKAKFTEDKLRHWLAWMRRNGLVPRGQGPRTAHTMTRDMFAHD
jgi:type I restriction enzyme S subunit